jgi:hypothetical protein
MAEEAFSKSSSLKSAAILDLMREHMKTEEGKKLSKIGLVYQIVLSPKVGSRATEFAHRRFLFVCALFSANEVFICSYFSWTSKLSFFL